MADRYVAFCPHCCNRAPQRLLHKQKSQDHAFEEDRDGKEIHRPIPLTFWVALCETCKSVLVYSNMGGDDPRRFVDAALDFPNRKLDFMAVPEPVRECYDEATRVKWASPSSFAVQIRRGLEATCDDKKVPKKRLQDRLAILVRQENLPLVLVEMANALRHIGNYGAHSDGEVKASHVWSIDSLFKAIVEYVYVAPAKLKDFVRSTKKAPPKVPFKAHIKVKRFGFPPDDRSNSN